MKPYILEGTPHVARRIEHIQAARVVAMLVVEEPAPAQTPVRDEPDVSDEQFARLWADSRQDLVAVGHVDDSREAIYTRMADE